MANLETKPEIPLSPRTIICTKPEIPTNGRDPVLVVFSTVNSGPFSG